MLLFTGLRKIREFERLQLPFLKSLIEFDILIEIGFAEEQGRPMTLQQLFQLSVSSRTTVRRKLAKLIKQGVVAQRGNERDRRATLLLIAPSALELLHNYGGALTSISAFHFLRADRPPAAEGPARKSKRVDLATSEEAIPHTR